MPRRVLLVLTAAVAALTVVVMTGPAAVAAATAPAGREAVATAPAPPGSVPDATDNPFIPPDKDLSACVSAVPQPGCGSKAHGGWRQFLVFVVVVLALAFIGWKIVTSVRRGRRELEVSDRGR
jgi:hypothetical protein